MVLDHGGPDFAFILYTSALKLWVLGALFVNVFIPLRTGYFLFDFCISLAGMFGMAVLVGVTESIMARLRLVRVPQLLVAAGALAGLALFLVMR
jgi:formate hydrogenlyase subunit 4